MNFIPNENQEKLTIGMAQEKQEAWLEDQDVSPDMV